MEWIKANSPIAFPGLGFEINPPTGFTVGNFEVMFYGLIIGLGLLLCCIYGLRRGKDFGLTQDDILDGALWIIPFAIVCARLYYCAFYWEKGGYGANPISILYIWEAAWLFTAVSSARPSALLFTACLRKFPSPPA